MSRQRFIYPDLYDSEKTSTLSLGARWLFSGMFTKADDYGRGHASVKALRIAVFPHDEFTLEQIRGWRDELAGMPVPEGDEPWVTFYTVAGHEYYYCPGWNGRQRPRYKAPSRIPAPPEPAPKQNQQLARSPGDPPEDPRLTPGGSAAVVGVGVGVEVGLKRGRGRSGVGVSGEGDAPAPARGRPALHGEALKRHLRSVSAKMNDPAPDDQDPTDTPEVQA